MAPDTYGHLRAPIIAFCVHVQGKLGRCGGSNDDINVDVSDDGDDGDGDVDGGDDYDGGPEKDRVHSAAGFGGGNCVSG